MSKTSRKNRKNRHAKATDEEVAQLNKKLEGFNLFAKIIDDDGNCLFRAVADQLEHVGFYNCSGSNKFKKSRPLSHSDIREKCVDYLRENSDWFRLFIDEDAEGSWESYLDTMSKDGEWATQLEIMAISKVLKVHMIVFQVGMGTLELRFDDDAPNSTEEQKAEKLQNQDRPCCLLAYIGGEHYNSIRLAIPLGEILGGKGTSSSDSKNVSSNANAKPDGETETDSSIGEHVLTLRRLKNDVYGEESWKQMLAIGSGAENDPQNITEVVKQNKFYQSFIEQLEDCIPEEKRTEIMTREKLLVDTFRRIVWGDELVGKGSFPKEEDGPEKDDELRKNQSSRLVSRQNKSKKKNQNTKTNKKQDSENSSKDASGEASKEKPSGLWGPRFDKEDLTESEKTDVLKGRIDDALEEILRMCV